PQLASAGANKDPLTTNSIASAAARPVAGPEARPSTIEGWTSREGGGGTGRLDGPSGVWGAGQGDTGPGIGRDGSVGRGGSRRAGGAWVWGGKKGPVAHKMFFLGGGGFGRGGRPAGVRAWGAFFPR